MASLDRVKVLVLGDSGEPLTLRLELPTRSSYPKPLSVRCLTSNFLAFGFMAEILSKTLKLHFPEDFAPFDDVVAWREVGGAEPGAFTALAFHYLDLPGDPRREYIVNSFLALVRQTEVGKTAPLGSFVL